MKSTARSLSTFSSMTFCLSKAKNIFFYLTSMTFGSILSRWVITFEEISDMSVADQAKISTFSLSKFINCCRSGLNSCDLIWTIFLGSSSFNGMKLNCSSGSSLCSSLCSLSFWFNLSTDKESLGLLFCVKVRKQHRASCWSPRISLTPLLVENQTNKWYVETTALRMSSPDRPSMTL